MEGSAVTLNVYDLSQGLAKSMSKGIVGIQIDGIWHTGIVVYGKVLKVLQKEFYFGGGVCVDPPARTPYGTPVQNIPLGSTEIPEAIFMDYLRELSPKFSIAT